MDKIFTSSSSMTDRRSHAISTASRRNGRAVHHTPRQYRACSVPRAYGGRESSRRRYCDALCQYRTWRRGLLG
eukprot:1034635-Rhodomonas_salina.2